MKFLVTVTPTQPAPMPPGAIADILAAQRDWLNQRLGDGTLDCAHAFIGGGGMGIANADSIEEMHALLVGSPAFALGGTEVRPLGDFNETIEAGIGALRRAASMMPGPAR
jgi:muconolactone delta-isomerase